MQKKHQAINRLNGNRKNSVRKKIRDKDLFLFLFHFFSFTAGNEAFDDFKGFTL